MFYFHDFVTYTSDGLYTTHPNGLPHPTRAFQIDEQNGATIPKQPDAIDFNSPHHYYLPFGKNVQQKKKKNVFAVPDINQKPEIPLHRQIIEPIEPDWPSPFINFYFPCAQFNHKYLENEGLVGFAFGVQTTKFSNAMKRAQDALKINLVNGKGQGHMPSQITVVKGQLISKCLGCGDYSDNCVCEIFDNGYIVNDLPKMDVQNLQIAYCLPKIKGICSTTDYVVLILDKKICGKNGESLHISTALCPRGSTNQSIESEQIPDIQGVQELSKTHQFNEPEIPSKLNVTRLVRDASGKWHQQNSGLSSGLGLGSSAVIRKNGKEKSSTQESGKTNEPNDSHSSTKTRSDRRANKKEKKKSKKQKRLQTKPKPKTSAHNGISKQQYDPFNTTNKQQRKKNKERTTNSLCRMETQTQDGKIIHREMGNRITCHTTMAFPTSRFGDLYHVDNLEKC